MLARLYKYATISYIGGGFGKGIHNTLEAAVYGNPVLFGPNYKKFNEAIELIAAGGAISINDTKAGVTVIEALMHDEIAYNKACEKSKEYVYANKGATETILNYIQEKRLLTNWSNCATMGRSVSQPNFVFNSRLIQYSASG